MIQRQINKPANAEMRFTSNDKEQEEYEKLIDAPNIDDHLEMRSGCHLVLSPPINNKAYSHTANNTALHTATKDGRVNAMKEIISDEGNSLINEDGHDGYTPLHLASKYGMTAAVDLLLDEGAQIGKKNRQDGVTALHLAAKFNNVDALQLLVKRGANVTSRDDCGKTPLHLAAYCGHYAIVQLLLEEGRADVNARDKQQRTALHDAASGGSAEVAQLLLNAGSNLKARSESGETPLHISARENDVDLVTKLLKEAAGMMKESEYRNFIGAKNYQNFNPLQVAVLNANIEVSEILLESAKNYIPINDENLLQLSFLGGNKDLATSLINLGAPFCDNMAEIYPLHRACERGILIDVQNLVEKKAPLDLKDINGFTPLMRGVACGKEDVVRYLIERGAQLQMRNWNFKSLLHIAVEKNQTKILKVLISYGCGNLVNCPDKNYSTPLHYAASYGNVLATRILLEKSGCIKNDHNGKGPLHCAAEGGHLECVKLLVAAAPDSINSIDRDERSPLALAASAGHRAVCIYLIKKGAKLMCLLSASNEEFIKLFEALIENGVSLPSIRKKNIIQFSEVEPEITCMKILCECKNQFIAKKCKDQWQDLMWSLKKEACMVSHKVGRINEVYKTLENSISTMDNLITFVPELAKYALDKSIEDKGYRKKYKFGLIDLHPDKMRVINYFGPQTMLNYNRQSLLTHTVTLKLLKVKWARLGLGIFLLGLVVYSIFLALLTTLVILDKQTSDEDLSNSIKINTTEEHMEGQMKRVNNVTKDIVVASHSMSYRVIPWITLIVCILQMLKELIRMRYMKMLFFKETTTFLEIITYIATLIYFIPFIVNIRKYDYYMHMRLDDFIYYYRFKMQAGAVAILCAWTTLLFYLKKIPAIGMYVWMFEEVIKTVLRLLLGLVILLLGFACAFFVVLHKINYFKTYEWSLMKTVIMTFGEFEYDNVFIKSKTSHRDITLSVFIMFLIIMPILFMNLLVGLAVGDIEAVRNSAYMRNFKCQVKTLHTLIHTYPKFVLRALHSDHVLDDPKKMIWRERFLEWFVDLEGDNKERPINDADDYAEFDEFERSKSYSLMEMMLEQHYDELFMNTSNDEENNSTHFKHRPFGRHTILM